MPAPTACTICEHPDRERIDSALRGGASIRSIGKSFGVGRTALSGHAAKHTTAEATRKYRVAAKGGRRKTTALAVADTLKPIESPDDVVADYQRIRIEAHWLFEQAKARADWKSAERLFSQLLDATDRFGTMYRLIGAKSAVTVNIDQRTARVAQFYDSLPTETLRRLVDGQITIDQVMDAVSEATS
jgi:predicted RNA methylase